jgi:hypothetical protein
MFSKVIDATTTKCLVITFGIVSIAIDIAKDALLISCFKLSYDYFARQIRLYDL